MPRTGQSRGPIALDAQCQAGLPVCARAFALSRARMPPVSAVNSAAHKIIDSDSIFSFAHSSNLTCPGYYPIVKILRRLQSAAEIHCLQFGTWCS